MTILLLEVPQPGAREQSAATLSHLRSCSLFQEGGCCQGRIDICGLSGEGRLWESASQWVDGSPCREGASGSLHCAIHSVADTKLPGLFFPAGFIPSSKYTYPASVVVILTRVPRSIFIVTGRVFQQAVSLIVH